MADPASGAAAFVPDRLSLRATRVEAASCRGCHLWEVGTRTVFGEGLRRSRLMLVGEMPGHEEDLSGKPFVGPAGRLLDEVLAEAHIDRKDAYVTNVVKHFKWEPRGRRRLHRSPNAREIRACLPWLDREIELIEPEVLVCLGATAAHALIGRDFSVTRQRGEFVASSLAPHVTATVHPSAILRLRTSDERRAARTQLLHEMKHIAEILADSNNPQDM